MGWEHSNEASTTLLALVAIWSKPGVAGLTAHEAAWLHVRIAAASAAAGATAAGAGGGVVCCCPRSLGAACCTDVSGSVLCPCCPVGGGPAPSSCPCSWSQSSAASGRCFHCRWEPAAPCSKGWRHLNMSSFPWHWISNLPLVLLAFPPRPCRSDRRAASFKTANPSAANRVNDASLRLRLGVQAMLHMAPG